MRSKIFLYFLAIFFTLLIETLIFSVPGFHWDLPPSYALDTVFSSAAIKTIIDTGWFITNPYLGAPGIFQLYDFPTSDSASMVIVYLLSFISHHYGVIYNLFFFITFPICAVLSLFVFLRLGLKSFFALGATLLYTFIAFHILRGPEHLFLCTYYVVPIYILFAVETFQGLTFSSMTKSQIFYRVIAIIFSASSGVYYAFFGIFFILLTGIYGWSFHRQKNAFRTACIFVALIAGVTIANTSPTIWYQSRVGHNAFAGHRETISGIETASLKMSQMLLPVTDHHLGFIRRYKNAYNEKAPLINENDSATLGFVGDIGFIMLLWLFLMKRREVLNPNIELFGILNVSAILVATVGGLSLFALMILPQIRSYNRISVFLSFFSLYTLFFYLQKRQLTWKFGIFLVLLIAFGLYDEIPRVTPNYAATQQAILSDQNYVKQIEKTLPKDSSIFQLPYSEFPEGPKVFHLLDYEQFKTYLNSSTHLKWSYGAMKGRGVSSWERSLTQMPLKPTLDQIVLAGFDGLSINRDGYEDNGQAIQTELSLLLHQQPLESPDKKLFFYNLISYKNQLIHKLGQESFSQQSAKLLSDMHVSYNWHPDFADPETHGNQSWRWVGKRGKLEILSDNPKDIKMTLSFSLQTGYAEPGTVKITGGPFHDTFKVNKQKTLVQKTFIMRPGSIKILFETDAKNSHQGPDEKSSYLRLNNFRSVIES